MIEPASNCIMFRLEPSPYAISTRGYGGDKVTAVHENTHGVNSKLRNSFVDYPQGKPEVRFMPLDASDDRFASAGPSFRSVEYFAGSFNCYQMYEQVYVKLDPTPGSITLKKVADACEWKGDIFNLYLVNSRRWWNDTPLYVYDEWVAYSNGASQQLVDGGSRSNDITFPYALEMAYYAYVAQSLMPDDWESKAALSSFWRWQAIGNLILSDDAEDQGLYSDKHRDRRKRLEDLLGDHPC